MVAARRVGMVGVGQMGLPIVQRLLAEDHPVTFYARRPEVSSELVASGAVDGRSLAGVADNSDVVIICVYDDDDVKDVCLGEEGVIANMHPGSILVNHTTGDPATARLLSRHARVRRVHFLDAALSGSPADIADAKLTLLVGGREAVLRRIGPVLGCYADPVVLVGRIGDGQWMKLVNNALLAANLTMVREAERALSAVGLPLEKALEALTHCSGDSRALRIASQMGSSEKLLEQAGRFIEKDIATIRDVARARKVDLGLLGIAASSLGGET
jgi:3-hydroxyisobutyrate dehydrogenase-like beta-hydroxyacid dehydrogenase